MSDFFSLAATIKQAAVDAVNATFPAAVLFGTVVSIDPIFINVEQKLTLGAEHLVFTQTVSDFHVDIHADHFTENALYDDLIHSHNVLGRKSVKIYHKLLVGDNVILLRVQGGQKFVVLDRLG